jgi:hypothetical protein
MNYRQLLAEKDVLGFSYGISSLGISIKCSGAGQDILPDFKVRADGYSCVVEDGHNS